MKKIFALAALLLLVALLFWIYKAQFVHPTNSVDQQYSFTEASEKYAGTINGDSIIFEEKDYTKYRLTTNGNVTLGPLNTERGYGDDIDATVYVLDWNKPDAEQKYFVRFTGDPHHIQLLDANRTIVSGALLEKVGQ